MRLLIKVFVFLAVLWCGWWALASYGVARGLDTMAAALNDEGWQADVETTQGGFPFSISTKVDLLDIVNPVTGRAFSLEGVSIDARTYWPGVVDIDLPTTPILFAGPTGEAALTVQDGAAKIRLRPGLTLELRQIEVSTAEWVFQSGNAEVLDGIAFDMKATQSEKGSAQYDITFSVDGLAVSEVARKMFALPAVLPEQFEIFAATGYVTFDVPLNRASSKGGPPKITQIAIDGADIVWGDIVLEAAGALEVGVNGIPEGTIELQAKDWRNLLDLAQSAGFLPRDRRSQTELLFGLLASRGGSRDDLDLELEFANGRMSLSGIPLGAAPRLVFQ